MSHGLPREASLYSAPSCLNAHTSAKMPDCFADVTGITVRTCFSSFKIANMFRMKDPVPGGLRSSVVHKFNNKKNDGDDNSKYNSSDMCPL